MAPPRRSRLKYYNYSKPISSNKLKIRSNPYPRFSLKGVILVDIFLVTIIVIIGTTIALLDTNGVIAQKRISALAADYYENYFYAQLTDPDDSSANHESTLSQYHERGLSPLTLRDLLLHDGEKYLNTRNYLTKYCDENHTIIKFYPDPPYERKSYHADISYSCNF